MYVYMGEYLYVNNIERDDFKSNIQASKLMVGIYFQSGKLSVDELKILFSSLWIVQNLNMYMQRRWFAHIIICKCNSNAHTSISQNLWR